MTVLINMQDQYQTRSGLPVRILCVDGPHEQYPVVAIIGQKRIETYTVSGNLVEGQELIEDLVKKPKFQVGDKWVTFVGNVATILHVSTLDEPHKLFGIIQRENSTLPYSWNENGFGSSSDHDLVSKINDS